VCTVWTDQLDATNSDLLVINSIYRQCTVWRMLSDSSLLTGIRQNSPQSSLPIVACPVVAVVMLESRVARCVHCVENFA
jgi:hypothetical protein